MKRLMKDSGIPWIGEIPADWSIERMKSIFKESKEKSEDGLGLLLSLSQYTGVHLKSDSDRTFNGESLEGYNVVHPGQFVMNIMLAWNGSYAVSDYEGLISPAYAVFNFTGNVHKKYFHYLLRTPAYSGAFKTMSRGIIDSRLRLYPEYFYTFPVILPPIPEQQKIAAFLDRKCGEVDELIALEEKMIEELKAYKQSVITETITKGLNPDALIKDSGIEWIGQIPEHWEVRRLRFLCRVTTGNQDTQDREDDGKYPFYVRSPHVERSNKYSFDGPAILMAGDGAGAGKVFHYVDGKYACHQRVYSLDKIQGINRRFLFYYLRELFYIAIESANSKSTVDSVRLPMLSDFPITIPSHEEQGTISEYLDKNCSNIDSLISIKQSKIAELQDYKKSIIYEYATGKKEVPSL